ncbi:MAG: hypothetical protein AAB649_05835, partial [Patescibacteria group bacterium]
LLDRSSDNDIKRADEEVQEIVTQVASGQLTDPALVYQKCEALWQRGGICKYQEFAIKTGNPIYCEYAGFAMYRQGGTPAQEYAAQCTAEISNIPTAN